MVSLFWFRYLDQRLYSIAAQCPLKVLIMNHNLWFLRIWLVWMIFAHLKTESKSAKIFWNFVIFSEMTTISSINSEPFTHLSSYPFTYGVYFLVVLIYYPSIWIRIEKMRDVWIFFWILRFQKCLRGYNKMYPVNDSELSRQLSGNNCTYFVFFIGITIKCIP